MTYVVMVVYLGIGAPALVPFKSEMSCGQAIPAMVEALATDYGTVTITCETTNTPLLRPVARPVF